MDVNELIESGTLELYAMGVLDAHEQQEIENLIASDATAKKELEDIELAIENYAFANRIKPSESVKEGLMKRVSGKTTVIRNINDKSKNSFMAWRIAASILFVSSAFLITKYVGLNDKNEELQLALDNSRTEIANVTRTSQDEIDKFNSLHSQESSLVALQATGDFATTEIYLYHNSTTKKNFLELKNLPEITKDQSFQLWSLKPDTDPIPLDVFQGENNLVEVLFEEGTDMYAITIEPFGGQSSPTLENLIGTMKIG